MVISSRKSFFEHSKLHPKCTCFCVGFASNCIQMVILEHQNAFPEHSNCPKMHLLLSGIHKQMHSIGHVEHKKMHFVSIQTVPEMHFLLSGIGKQKLSNGHLEHKICIS